MHQLIQKRRNFVAENQARAAFTVYSLRFTVYSYL